MTVELLLLLFYYYLTKYEACTSQSLIFIIMKSFIGTNKFECEWKIGSYW